MNVEIGLWLFMVYSVLGWVLETVFCAIKHGKFVNRGFLNGPVCGIYGVVRDIKDDIVTIGVGPDEVMLVFNKAAISVVEYDDDEVDLSREQAKDMEKK